MSENDLAARLPEVGEFVRGHGTLVRVEEIPPELQPPPKKVYIFEQNDARWEVRFGNEVLSHSSKHNEFYGQHTAVPFVIKEAKAYCKKNKIGPKHALEVVVIRIVDEEQKVPARDENCYDRQFIDFAGAHQYASHKNISETVVWTSRKPKVLPKG
jgi:hypothetical protein